VQRPIASVLNLEEDEMNMTEINDQIINLWKRYPITKRTPLLYPTLKSHTLLFIGLNPSFSERGFTKVLRGTKYKDILNSLHGYFDFESIDKDKIETLTGIEQEFRNKHPYFKKCGDLSSSLKLEWEHIDLLVFRETNQKEVVKLIKGNAEFVEEQIKLALTIINNIMPEIMLIQNAYVSKLLQKRLDLKFMKNMGTYCYKHMKSDIPVFLSGMLTGGRALDNGSYERLKWHMQYVKDNFLGVSK
jgi:hypothetical protein